MAHINQPLFSILQTFGWVWEGDTLYAPGGSMWFYRNAHWNPRRLAADMQRWCARLRAMRGHLADEALAEALGDAESALAAATAVDELNVSPADEGQHAPRHEGAAV
ncbi:MAG: hypothetical protein AAGA54_07185 [Myxococcota bacterium]